MIGFKNKKNYIKDIYFYKISADEEFKNFLEIYDDEKQTDLIENFPYIKIEDLEKSFRFISEKIIENDLKEQIVDSIELFFQDETNIEKNKFKPISQNIEVNNFAIDMNFKSFLPRMNEQIDNELIDNKEVAEEIKEFLSDISNIDTSSNEYEETNEKEDEYLEKDKIILSDSISESKTIETIPKEIIESNIYPSIESKEYFSKSETSKELNKSNQHIDDFRKKDLVGDFSLDKLNVSEIEFKSIGDSNYADYKVENKKKNINQSILNSESSIKNSINDSLLGISLSQQSELNSEINKNFNQSNFESKVNQSLLSSKEEIYDSSSISISESTSIQESNDIELEMQRHENILNSISIDNSAQNNLILENRKKEIDLEQKPIVKSIFDSDLKSNFINPINDFKDSINANYRIEILSHRKKALKQVSNDHKNIVKSINDSLERFEKEQLGIETKNFRDKQDLIKREQIISEFSDGFNELKKEQLKIEKEISDKNDLKQEVNEVKSTVEKFHNDLLTEKNAQLVNLQNTHFLNNLNASNKEQNNNDSLQKDNSKKSFNGLLITWIVIAIVFVISLFIGTVAYLNHEHQSQINEIKQEQVQRQRDKENKAEQEKQVEKIKELEKEVQAKKEARRLEEENKEKDFSSLDESLNRYSTFEYEQHFLNKDLQNEERTLKIVKIYLNVGALDTAKHIAQINKGHNSMAIREIANYEGY